MTAAATSPATTAPKLPLDLGGKDFIANRFDYYSWLLEERPVCPARISLMPIQLVSRYQDCVDLVKDERFVRNRATATGGGRRTPFPMPKSIAFLTESMIQTDDPEHRRLRTLVNQAFKPAAVAKLGGRIDQITSELLDAALEKGSIDLMTDFALPIPVTVIAEMVGVDQEDMPEIRGMVSALSEGLSGWTILRTLLWDMRRVVGFVRELVARKRSRPGDDILTALIQAEEHGDRLTEDELVAMVFLLIIAGYETTVHLITNGVLTLLEHPDQLARLREEPELMGKAVEEILRFAGPIQGSKPCYAREDVELHGVQIKKGKMVMPLYGAANRDPREFEHPDVFDIARDPNPHLGFGHGIHFCLGAQLARLETRTAIGALVERAPNLRLAVPAEKLEQQRLPGWYRYTAMPVELT